MELIGLPLSLALETLAHQATAHQATAHQATGETPTIIYTAPPFVSKTRVPTWGEARVLRVTRHQDRLELLVARELLGETKTSVSL